ncbi:MAG: nickel pincer cofactor biosynthesis protein LarC [Spirochaetaceae bacterium]|nr:nickel pincer cofactor biosynthesis protein LarC [Spirochaetaceae bacterium]
MTVAYVDCIAGVSGDMLLGALLDAGVAEAELRARLDDLHLPGFALSVRRVQKVGIGAVKVDVQVTDHATARHVPAIVELVERSAVADHVKRRAAAIFRRLGEVEAAIHGTSPERVHLHELGGIDTIVDVVGVLIGFDLLGVERVVCSPLPLARGFVDAAHGRMPLPAPATVALLEGVPVTGAEVTGELVTPTGAALITALATEFGPLPAMELTATGYGAGSADRSIPNVVRLLVGRAAESSAVQEDRTPVERLFMIETNIDDMNPEWYDYVGAALFGAGAREVFTQPAAMKKNRPATLLSVLCRPGDRAALRRVLFRETTTIGVREYPVQRYALQRATTTVTTRYGSIRVKLVHGAGIERRCTPEYDDCRAAAESGAVPLQEVYRAALDAARALPEESSG